MKSTLLSLAAIFSFQSLAGPIYYCQKDDQERIIEVEYLKEDSRVPCQVNYTKYGKSEKLWSAINVLDYCEDKAAAFVDKQKSWGWQCTLKNPAPINDKAKKIAEFETRLNEKTNQKDEEELTQEIFD